MTARLLTFVACRLLAIYMLVGLVRKVSITIISTSTKPTHSAVFPEVISILVYYLPVDLALIAVLWFAAKWISKHAVNADLPENASASWRQDDILSVAICIFGVFIIVTALPHFTFLLINLDFDSPHIAGPLISSFFGILLIFGSERISKFISKLRRL